MPDYDKVRKGISIARELFRVVGHVSDSGIKISDESRRLVERLDNGHDPSHYHDENFRRRRTYRERSLDSAIDAEFKVLESSRRKNGGTKSGKKKTK